MDFVPQSFKTALASRGYRAGTVEVYAKNAKQLLAHFGVPARQLQTRDVQEWIVYAQNELEWKPRTVNVALAAFKVLFESVGRSAVMAAIPNLRFDHVEPQVLAAAHVAAILRAASTVTLRAAVAILYGAGLRISELLALCFADIDSLRGVLRIETSKNRHARHALLPLCALPLLRELWRLRRANGGVSLEQHVFVSSTGKPLERHVIATALARAAGEAGVPQRVYPHLLRHSFATSMIEQGADVTTVQKLLGHRSLSSTGRYVHLTAATRARLKSPADTMLLPPPRTTK